MYDDEKLIAKVPLSWRKSFIMGVVISHEISCNKYSEDVLCDDCDKLVNQNKELSVNINEIKRQAPNENSFIFSWYEKI